MTMWNAWGWCGHLPAIVALWAMIFAAMMFAAGFIVRQRNDPPAATRTGPIHPEGVAAGRAGRSEMGDDDFYRRLM